MRKTTLLLILTIVVMACNTSTENEENEVLELPFYEYSLEGFFLRYENFDMNKVVIINSNNELEKYFIEPNYLDIDFSKYTLMLARGAASNGIEKKKVNSLQQLSANKYKLNVEITLNDATVAEGWRIALIMSKFSEKIEIELNVMH